jgi:TatD DNase family protein
MNKFFDAHTHAHFAAFKEDYRDAIRRALAAGVGLVNVGTQKDTSRRAVEVAHEFENEPVYAAIGLHPIHTSKSHHDENELGGGDSAKAFTSRGEEFEYEYYKKLALDPKTVAIGECGLDYFHMEGDVGKLKRRQKEALLGQIKLAHDVEKPLMIHCRDAFDDLIEMLTTNHQILNTIPGIIHFFTGTKDDAKKLLDLGFRFTFGGTVTYPPKAGMPDYAALVRFLPLDRILSETDAPYVAPVPYRGKRNEPAYVVETVKKLAEIKGIPADEMAEATVANAARIFHI